MPTALQTAYSLKRKAENSFEIFCVYFQNCKVSEQRGKQFKQKKLLSIGDIKLQSETGSASIDGQRFFKLESKLDPL
jgi:hypothetical protein